MYLRRVEGGKEVDEQGDQRNASPALFRDQEAQASSEQSPGHLRESTEQKVTATERIDRPDGGESEDPVNQSKTEGGEKCLLGRVTGFGENARRVEGDDVDSASRRKSMSQSKCGSSE